MYLLPRHIPYRNVNHTLFFFKLLNIKIKFAYIFSELKSSFILFLQAKVLMGQSVFAVFELRFVSDRIKPFA